MTPMMRALRWAVPTGVAAGLLWAALAHGSTGAERLFIAMTWLSIPLAFLSLFSPAVQNAMVAKGGPSVPLGLQFGVSVAFAAVLVWYGWWWTAAAYLLCEAMRLGAWFFVSRSQNIGGGAA